MLAGRCPPTIHPHLQATLPRILLFKTRLRRAGGSGRIGSFASPTAPEPPSAKIKKEAAAPKTSRSLVREAAGAARPVPVLSADPSFHGLALAGFDARLRRTAARCRLGRLLGSAGPRGWRLRAAPADRQAPREGTGSWFHSRGPPAADGGAFSTLSDREGRLIENPDLAWRWPGPGRSADPRAADRASPDRNNRPEPETTLGRFLERFSTRAGYSRSRGRRFRPFLVRVLIVAPVPMSCRASPTSWISVAHFRAWTYGFILKDLTGNHLSCTSIHPKIQCFSAGLLLL